MKREYQDYLQDILASIEEIEGFIKDMRFLDFEKDAKTKNAVIRSLEVIDEAAKKIPSEIRSKHSDIPWKSIAGMRDKLIHEYFGFDAEIIWEVASHELPTLKEKLEEVFEESS